MNLVLIGYRGTGKSEAAQRLKEHLNLTRIGLDAELVERAELSIPEYVEQNGWPAFRDLETEIVRDASQKDGLIIDCGGGVIERPENIPLLKENGLVFWLKASVDVVVKRIESGTQRPALLEGKTFTEEVAEVLAVRTPKYLAASDFVIDTDGKSLECVADEIVKLWEERNT